MKDLIVIAGAPGTGKTTVSKLLAKKLGSFALDFGVLRQIHLKPDWSDGSKEEEEMAFENLTFILKNYKKHGYKNVVLNDLQDFRVQQIPQIFSDFDYTIFSLFVTDDRELKKRIEDERNSGFKDVAKAVAWNHMLRERPSVARETKIDNTHNAPEKTMAALLELLGQ